MGILDHGVAQKWAKGPGPKGSHMKGRRAPGPPGPPGQKPRALGPPKIIFQIRKAFIISVIITITIIIGLHWDVGSLGPWRG